MTAIGLYPDALEISKVIPLYKKGDEANISNYRPIAPIAQKYLKKQF